MLYSPDTRPTLAQAEEWPRAALPRFEASGVDLALETYEQVATDEPGRPDRAHRQRAARRAPRPGNVVARLERPRDCVEATAPHVKNIHVKDFAFARQAGWVGFTYGGAPMGEGLHDYAHLLDTVRPREARRRRAEVNEISSTGCPGRETPRTDHPNRAGMDPHHRRIPEEHRMSTTADPTPRGHPSPTRSPSSEPAARWACASPNNLVKTAHEVAYVENSPAGKQRTIDAGRELTDAATAVADAEIVVLAVPDLALQSGDRRTGALAEGRRDRADARSSPPRTPVC